MDEVQPLIDEATEALAKISPSDFNDIKGANTVSAVLEIVFEALIYILEPAKEDSVYEKNNETMKTEINYWKTFKRMLMDVKGIVETMKTY